VVEVAVIDDPAAAQVSLHPVRSRLLAELTGQNGLRLPASATHLAARVRLPRQRVSYHLAELRRHGLVEVVSERRRGNVMERLLRATASAYVISPLALASLAPDPAQSDDQLSDSWLLAVAARLLRDAGLLATGGGGRTGEPEGTPLVCGVTCGIGLAVHFASPAARVAFAAELVTVIGGLLARHHDERAAAGHDYRVVVALHPRADVSATRDGAALLGRDA
jgi:DNA-binding transcriptional ArsR family regulator